MKILFLADTHISERHGMGGAGGEHGVTDFEAAARQVIAVAAMPGIDLIVHLGDLFDRPRPTPREYVIAQSFVRALTDAAPVYIVEGNHDRDATQRALGPLEGMEQLEIVSAPRSRAHGAAEVDRYAPGTVLHFLPYPPPAARLLDQWGDKAGRNAELGAGLDLVLEGMAREVDASPHAHHILCAHVTFSGSRYAETRSVGQWDLAVPTDTLAHFDAVFAGHLHVRQPIGNAENAHYVGPLTRWGFGDAGIPTGCCIYDTSTGVREWHDIEGGIDFVTLDVEHLHGAARAWATSAPGAVARLVGEAADAARYQEACDLVDAIRVDFLHLRNDVTIAKAEGQLRQASADTVADIFGAYIEARPDAVPEDMRDEVVAHVDEIMRGLR